MRVTNILETIGKTPHVRINRLFGDNEVWLKLEKFNPGGSIKDRIALSMIEEAEKRGVLKPGSIIVEPTSGNTGIGLAMVAAVKGYKIIIVMPDNFSAERKKLLTAYGAQLELTPGEKGMKGAIDRANELVNSIPNAWMPQQFENEANIEAHRQTTAKEILEDFPEGLDILVAGVGTGGHITGCAEELKKKFKSLKVYAVEPERSSVISGNKAGSHRIQGIGAGFVPKNFHINSIDGVIKVSDDEAFEYARRVAREEGLLVGISTGAVLAAVGKLIAESNVVGRILTFNYDTGERYLSEKGLFEF